MKAVVAAFNQEKALVGAISVITNLRMELFQALVQAPATSRRPNLTKPGSRWTVPWWPPPSPTSCGTARARTGRSYHYHWLRRNWQKICSKKSQNVLNRHCYCWLWQPLSPINFSAIATSNFDWILKKYDFQRHNSGGGGGARKYLRTIMKIFHDGFVWNLQLKWANTGPGQKQGRTF